MEGSFGRWVIYGKLEMSRSNTFRCLSPPLFTFTVGDNKKEVTVHSFALAGLSHPLNALINGGMIEAKTRHVDWSYIDEDTFARLCEFAYVQNYTPPKFRLIDGKSPSTKVTEKPKEKKKRKKNRPGFNWNDNSMEPAPEPEPEPEEAELEAPPYEDACDDREIIYKERSV